jgi:hypothetical protein
VSPRKKKPTLGGMILAGGWHDTRVALRYASRYGLACEGVGHAPSIEEYRSFHGLSRAQAYKDWKAWKRCVGEVSPLEVVSDEALAERGMSESDREDAIARWLAK